MLANTGYLSGMDVDESYDEITDFVVCSCGYYKLLTVERMETCRPQGRRDWQLLYVAQGEASFGPEGEEQRMGAGTAVLYRPGEPQRYCYRREDRPKVYWLHFSGRAVRGMLEELDLLERRMVCVGVEWFPEQFERLIREYQLQPAGYRWLAAGLAQELLARLARELQGGGEPGEDPVHRAKEEMHRRYRENLSIAAYAKQYNMSLCWFIRRFKAATGLSPHQYLTRVRIDKAREMLRGTSLNIGEVGAMVGYDNPLYFSRMFKAGTGLSPSRYRQR